MSKQKNSGEKEEKKVKNIPPDSPLGQMLEQWEINESTKDLNKVKMIHYCIEVWPTLDLPGEWPWCGTRDPWMCSQLNQYLTTRGDTNTEQMRYAACWQKHVIESGTARICKLQGQKKKEEEEKEEGSNHMWDPLNHLPPPPAYPVIPQVTPPNPSVLPVNPSPLSETMASVSPLSRSPPGTSSTMTPPLPPQSNANISKTNPFYSQTPSPIPPNRI